MREEVVSQAKKREGDELYNFEAARGEEVTRSAGKSSDFPLGTSPALCCAITTPIIDPATFEEVMRSNPRASAVRFRLV